MFRTSTMTKIKSFFLFYELRSYKKRQWLCLTCTVGKVVLPRARAGAAGVAGREVGESVGSAHGRNVVHVALAAKVAGGGQVDLEGLGSVTEKKVIENWNCEGMSYDLRRKERKLKSFVSPEKSFSFLGFPSLPPVLKSFHAISPSQKSYECSGKK